MECPICNGYGDPIGILGGLEHFRCRQSGHDFHYIVDMDVYSRAMRDRLLEDPEAVWTYNPSNDWPSYGEDDG